MPCSSPPPAVDDAADVGELGPVGVRRERLVAAVGRDQLGHRLADRRHLDKERGLEIVEDLAVAAADPQVLLVHEQVGADLQVGHPVDLRVDVPRARSTAAQHADRDAVGLDQPPRLDRGLERLERPGLTFGVAVDVHEVSGVRLEAPQVEIGQTVDRPRQFERRFAGGDARAPGADIEVDQYPLGDALGHGRLVQPSGRGPVIDHEGDLRALLRESDDPPDLVVGDDRRRDQDLVDARLDHDLRLADLRAADADPRRVPSGASPGAGTCGSSCGGAARCRVPRRGPPSSPGSAHPGDVDQ